MGKTEQIKLKAAKFWDAHPGLDNRIMEKAFDSMHHGRRFSIEDIAREIIDSRAFLDGLSAYQLAHNYGTLGW
ncbi:hypothetical protein [Bifidobacterium callitrichidarum]|uniref:Uncharacterized protein n=1 Tax=Bifidobacterium callitrichidarum TaxID=2052941 RepID=A0A2U2MYS7_9BIFI|nr:hypothetical protein [Bifidobacterium callitrichidarum]PWG62086.1 hypothetical protein DF196_12730 [Bifidobacterium callitrichidarum]